MNNTLKKVAVYGTTVSTAATLAVGSMVGAAHAAAPTPETVITGAATDLKDSLLSIGTTVLPLGAAVLALTIGWRFAKKFVRG